MNLMQKIYSWMVGLALLAPHLISTSAAAEVKKSTAQSLKGKSKTGTQEVSKKKKPPADDPESDEDSPVSASNKTTETPSTQKKASETRKKAFIGISADLGYEATYGNGIAIHLYPASFLDLNLGAGYNTTGAKAGVGPGILLWFTQSAGMLFGASYVYSQGSSGKVSLDANFTPDGSTNTEKIKATKKYMVSSAQVVGAYAGMTFHLAQSIRVDLRGCYNKVVAGNKVTFDDKIEYDKTISPTNEDAFNKQFDSQASDLVQAGGLGFSIGLQFLL